MTAVTGVVPNLGKITVNENKNPNIFISMPVHRRGLNKFQLVSVGYIVSTLLVAISFIFSKLT